MELRRDEFAGKLSNLTGVTLAEAEEEVDKSVQRLFYWASYADKYGGTVQETQLYGTVIKIHEPVGVIGIFIHNLKNPMIRFIYPRESPLCGFFLGVLMHTTVWNQLWGRL